MYVVNCARSASACYWQIALSSEIVLLFRLLAIVLAVGRELADKIIYITFVLCLTDPELLLYLQLR